MTVKKIMAIKPEEVITTKAETSIDEAMDLLISNKIGCLPVVEDDGKLIGIVSDHDIFARIHATKGNYHSLKVADLMITNLIVGLPDDDLEYIAGVMKKNWIRHVPIVKGDHVIGIISQRDIIKSQAKRAEVENRYLMDMLQGGDRSGDI
ncbi:MAG: CBS domain-containing protein [candidate division Zixibacteria bacterium]|nr:CBS domain-containing protein [candidate division Zixibacteria bacterium]